MNELLWNTFGKKLEIKNEKYDKIDIPNTIKIIKIDQILIDLMMFGMSILSYFSFFIFVYFTKSIS